MFTGTGTKITMFGKSRWGLEGNMMVVFQYGFSKTIPALYHLHAFEFIPSCRHEIYYDLLISVAVSNVCTGMPSLSRIGLHVPQGVSTSRRLPFSSGKGCPLSWVNPATVPPKTECHRFQTILHRTLRNGTMMHHRAPSIQPSRLISAK